MIRSPFHTAAGLTVIAGTLSLAQVSRADDVTVVAPEPAPVVVVRPETDTVQTRTESTGPDMRKIGGGIVTFGISYGVAVVVAATSDHQGDNHLYVPIVGPWLDFGDRQARCFIWDISQGGARLSVDNPVGEIPCAFSLLLSKDGHVRSHCEVIWVDQQYIGVRFVSPAP